MCFEADSTPPVASNGAPVRARHLVLEAADGNQVAAFEALSPHPGGPGVVVLPDVRGLFPFYTELAVRFAESGLDSVAIDYFGRTAGPGERPTDFPFMDHVGQTSLEGIDQDVAAALAHLRAEHPERPLFTVGFCFGGSNSWHMAAGGHGLAGAIGFYGNPRGARPAGAPPVIDRVGSMECPILGLMAGDDPGIPAGVVAEFDEALASAGVERQIVTYPGAPHSFFDRRQEDYAEESADAWQRVLDFIRSRSG